MISQAYRNMTTQEGKPMTNNNNNTLQRDIRWQDKNYVYEEGLKYLEVIGRTDLVNDLGYLLSGYTKRQLIKASVNGLQGLAEEAERMQRISQEMHSHYRTRS